MAEHPSHTELVQTLRATTAALQAHVDDNAKQAAVTPDIFCPCAEHELRNAYSVLKSAGVSKRDVLHYTN